MMSDHLVRPLEMESRYPYSADGQMATGETTPYLDPWILFAHLASATKRLRFMSSVYIPALRDPFTVAKALSTAALLTDERVLFGIGVGWMEEEFVLTERSFSGRGQRTDELVEVVRKLLSGEVVEHRGEHYDFGPVQMAPVPSRMPPVLAGGHSNVALRRAARMDGWIGVNYDIPQLTELLDVLARERASIGRADKQFDVATALNTPPSSEDVVRLERAGVTMILNPPLIDGSGSATDFGEKREQLEKFADQFIKPHSG